jgi:hypothetical protein
LYHVLLLLHALLLLLTLHDLLMANGAPCQHHPA